MEADVKKTVAQLLATPLQFLKGVGPERGKVFAKLGLETVRDLLFFFPRDYLDFTDVQAAGELEDGIPVTVRGVIEELDSRWTSRGMLVGMLVRIEQGAIRGVWFNQGYIRERYVAGQQVLLVGRPKFRGGRWEMSHPRVQLIETEEDLPTSSLQPVYPLTEGLAQRHVRNAVSAALAQYVDALEEVFPEPLRLQYGLLGLSEALREMHAPGSRATLEQARHRFVFQELFILQLALTLRRHEQRHLRQAPPLGVTAKIDARIRRLLPFELTADQQQAIEEITRDMAQDRPMQRLLHGDVGSGKTVVAVYAMMLTVAHGQQAVLMAPTEVLAVQHAQTLGRALARSQVRIALLTGGQTKSERRAVVEQIARGEIDLVIGTQAIVQSELEFARLGLVIIDEQHKFGVRQRAALKQSGLDPHYLVMTATPIPRTVGLTLFGDLDVSTIRQGPPGRQQVHTYLVEPEQEARWWEFVRKKLREGRQAYVVAPLVEESAEAELDSAELAFETLANGELEAFRLDLLHGRMNAVQKETAMQAFREGRTQVLVATTVIEVGIDVPNATVMTIQAAERFGLAQLHQLRGRVSRGTASGYCAALGKPQTGDGQARLDAFAATSDGFELAEVDFKLRGPGDLLGTRQHGLPPLRVADLVRDAELLNVARQHALQLVEGDPSLMSPDHARLRKMVLARYGRALNLGSVG